ncbi:unnamed protein product [Fusarium graminearum]|nr:unnamed protein product [Fusarium graminearum]CZS79181.1 unnamed protein product [Fusarium graminearum]
MADPYTSKQEVQHGVEALWNLNRPQDSERRASIERNLMSDPRIQSTSKDYQLTACHAATILLVPMEQLREGGSLDHRQHGAVLKKTLQGIARLVGLFFQNKREDNKDSTDESPLDSPSPPEEGTKRTATKASKRHKGKEVKYEKDEPSKDDSHRNTRRAKSP